MLARDGFADELRVEDNQVRATLGREVGEDLVVPLGDGHAAYFHRGVLVTLYQLAEGLAGWPGEPDDLQGAAAATTARGSSSRRARAAGCRRCSGGLVRRRLRRRG